MVQLETNGWGRVGDDLTPKSENYYVGHILHAGVLKFKSDKLE